ncbi:hypothetical protein BKA67DRAFT_593295 [Truncatella angustata]|uniref:Uncharacterized protein n=1 Tax=Truncatella angustata TaxID=152316 RepID=A0A9P8ZWT0_9PEZI|nr:uncharacterized protein BKA67DRAFT_593295 [Truncatella angustata]KAH6653356.1 hypothetical protein BKA67DRAFT_593295 [Truncatella angustata]
MLSLGIVLTEIPSNMILYRLFLFGVSGFIPGGLWTLSTWYTRSETAKRVMIFYFGNQIGQGSAKLLEYGILHMHGVGGQPGWFWLFALMGAFTVLGGFIFGFCLPDSFQNPHSTFLPRFTWFTDRELHILQTRVLLDDRMKGKKKKWIGRDDFKRAVSLYTNWRICVHLFITLCNNGPQRAFDTYAPSIVTSFGFGSLVSNAMAAVGLFSQVPVNLRGETVIIDLLCHLLGYIFNRAFTEVNLRGVRYFGVLHHIPCSLSFQLGVRDDNISVPSVIMGANVAGIYGAQIFRSDDRPLYSRGFSIAISVLCVGLILAIIRWIDDTESTRSARMSVESQVWRS